MANYTELINLIRSTVFNNTERRVTGEALQSLLVQIVQTLSGDIPAAINVINNLTSTSTSDALSAAQGKVLNEAIAELRDLIESSAGINYLKVTSAQYAAAQSAGTLSDSVLYIIVD